MTGILLDQGLPRSTAVLLREEGWNVIHTGDIGLSTATDREILKYARTKKLVVITLDADFHAILAVENEGSPSVIRIRIEGLKGNELSDLIKKIWPKISNELKLGAMVTIGNYFIRIRKMPIFEN